ncbi:TPA: Hin recombinase, partial [Acinetobacter baumannii]|nr:Hin recombinase [Acinetobacter baumannii]
DDPYKGRKPSLTPEQVALLHQRLESGDYKTKRALAKEFGISAPTLYRYQ